jgi:DNA-binding transcriptional LysR family regulator
LRDLHIVLAVAEPGSMAKASTRLSISHPVVRRFPSWNRLWASACSTAAPREPTPNGRALLEAGVNVFDEMRQGFKRIEFLADVRLVPIVLKKSFLVDD